MKPRAITIPQLTCYTAIKVLTRRLGVTPTIKEIAAEIDSSIGVVGQFLEALQKKGYIRRKKLPNAKQYLSRHIECLK